MLAQSAIAEGDLLSASQHFAAAIRAQPEDGYLLAQYAETLFLLEGSQFSGPVVDAMDRAFAVDSSNPTVLGLKGIQAFQDRHLQLAVTYWQGARPMPLAARKLRAADLPATLVLTDSDALMAGQGLSSANEVRLVARLSATGSATPQPGDWETSSEVIALPSTDIVRLSINRQRP